MQNAGAAEAQTPAYWCYVCGRSVLRAKRGGDRHCTRNGSVVQSVGETRGMCEARCTGAGAICEMAGDGKCAGRSENETRGLQKPERRRIGASCAGVRCFVRNGQCWCGLRNGGGREVHKGFCVRNAGGQQTPELRTPFVKRRVSNVQWWAGSVAQRVFGVVTWHGGCRLWDFDGRRRR